MVTDLFGAILQELGDALKMVHPGLQADENHTCLLKLKGDILIQIEIDRSGKYLIMGSELGAISPGRYRENLLTEAMKANAMPHPRYGTLAYSHHTDQLALFEMLSLRNLTGSKVAEFMMLFSAKAMLWKEALQRGEVPVIAPTSNKSSPNIFGLRP